MEKQIKIVKKGKDESNLTYWLSLSKKERLANLEEMRQQIINDKYDTKQGFLQRSPWDKEFIASLNDHDVKYLVIGGYAVNFHGYPRYTKDIDFWIKPDNANIQSLLSAIKDFGFGSLGLKEEDFTDPDAIIQLGYAPRRIDLLTAVEGLDFDNCYNQKNHIVIENVELNFLGIRNLIKAKKVAGRSQDLADAEQLEKIKNNE